MSYNSFLVARSTIEVGFDQSWRSSEELANGADYVPVSWFSLFSADDFVALLPGFDEEPEMYPAGALTLITSKKKAVERLRTRQPRILRVAPAGMKPYLDRLIEALEATEHDYVQLEYTDLDHLFPCTETDLLANLIETTDTDSVERWDELLSYVDCGLEGSWSELRYSPNTVVNAFVGWVDGEPHPESFGD